MRIPLGVCCLNAQSGNLLHTSSETTTTWDPYQTFSFLKISMPLLL